MLNMVIGFLNIGTSEMLLIVFVALMLFGGKKLPELARGLGRGIREFKDASESIKRDISQQINEFEQDVDVKNLIVDEEREQSKSSVNKPADSTIKGGEEDQNSPKSETEKASGSTPNPAIPAALQSGPPAGTYQHTRGREPDYQGENPAANTPPSDADSQPSEADTQK